MSWSKFNESFNSLKGQVTTFIQDIVPEDEGDVLAEGPDNKLEEMGSLVAAQENEIAILRRQVAELRQQGHSKSGHQHEGGSVNASTAASGGPQAPQSVASGASQQPHQQQQQLLEEDSWFWEPEKTTSSSASSTKTGDPIISKSGSGSDLTLIPLDQPCSATTITTNTSSADRLHGNRASVEAGEFAEDQRRRLTEQEQQVKKLTIENAVLSEKNKQLQAEAREANENIEELDKQHNLIMETIMEQKNGLQAKCSELTEERSQLAVKFKQMEQDFIASQEDYLVVQREFADYKNRFSEDTEQQKLREFVAKEEIEDLLKDFDFTLASDDPLVDLKVLLESRQQSSSDSDEVVSALEQKLSEVEAKLQQASEEKKKLAHEKDTLQADLINYEIECAELLKNNEKLLEELEQTKGGKLETIPEHSEESFTVLEKQLEDTVAMNRNLEDDYNELNLKYATLTEEVANLESERTRLDDELRETISKLRDANVAAQQSDEERTHLVFQLNELQSTTDNDDDDDKEQRDQQLEELRSQLTQLEREIAESRQAIKVTNERSEQAAEQLSNTQSELEASRAAVQVHEQLNNALIAEKQKLHDENGNYAAALQQLTEEKNDLERSLAASKAATDAKVAAFEDQLRSLDVDREAQHQQHPSDDEIEELKSAVENQTAEIARLNGILVQLGQEKNELINLVTTKHQESLQYHAEVQRVGALLQQEVEKKRECEKCPELLEKIEQLKGKLERMDELERQSDQVHFLKEKSDILTSNLLVEQNLKKMLQKEKEEAMAERMAVEKDVERLRQHLMAVEEEHTGQMMELQRQMEDYKARASAMEHEAKYASTAYTSANIRANQQNETLQAQYKLLEQHRDEMAVKLSQAEDRDSKNEAALVNLECALEQFQKEKQRDIENALYLVRKEVAEEKQRYANLMGELQGTQGQLNEAKAGLLAAARISDQLESSQRLVADQKEELRKLEEKATKMEQQMKRSEETESDKVEKGLIKNLVIGYMTAPNNGKGQILKLLSAVLEFSPVESERVGVNKSQSGWLGGLLHSNAGENSANEGLAQAFVKFLEQESGPMAPAVADSRPALLNMMSSSGSSETTAASTPGAHNLFHNQPENVSSVPPLPTSIQQPTLMADATMQHTFAPSRNSSSILKDVLNDT